MAQTVKNLPTVQETWIRFLGWEDPWRRKWQSIPGLLSGKSHEWRSLVGCSPWGCKELDTTVITTGSSHSGHRPPCPQSAAPLTLVWTETTLLSPRGGQEGQISSRSSQRVKEMRKGPQAMDCAASRKRQGNDSPWLLLLLLSHFSHVQLCATP